MKRSTSILIFLVLGVTIIITCCTEEPPLPPDSTFDQEITGSFDFGGHNRVYKMFLPKNYSSTSNLPLMIYLHAYDWTVNQGMYYTRMNFVADTSGFILVAPSAIGKRWNNSVVDDPSWPQSDVDDVGFINALIDTLINRFPYIDQERIYICGFSSGGYMTYRLAWELSHRIAAIASVAGTVDPTIAANSNPLHTMPVLHIHGTRDNVVSLNGGEYSLSAGKLINYFTDLNDCVQVDTFQLPDLEPSDGCTVEKISYTNCTGESNIIFFKVINGGHSWPSAIEDYSWSGNRNLDINASVEICNFFKNYKLN